MEKNQRLYGPTFHRLRADTPACAEYRGRMELNNIVEMPPKGASRLNKPRASSSRNRPRIVLADDQQEVLRTVSRLLKHHYKIVGAAQDGERVLELVRSEAPDLLVLDIFMPGLNGIETANRLRASGCRVKVLFLTVLEDTDYVDAALSVGGLGYVLKAHLVTDLLPAIREALKGSVFISPSLRAS
ncbi:MAG TPA: response regulator transcription factor [Dongiaceae bacterium]|nr:response regulator transcription factor [Dongiaceae bacterium]